jgi:hypothetical protein
MGEFDDLTKKGMRKHKFEREPKNMAMTKKQAQAILEAMQYMQEERGGAKKTKRRAQDSQDWTETQEEPLVPSKKQKNSPPIAQDSQVAGVARGRGGGRGRARGQGRGSAARGRGASASQVCPTCGHNCD